MLSPCVFELKRIEPLIFSCKGKLTAQERGREAQSQMKQFPLVFCLSLPNKAEEEEQIGRGEGYLVTRIQSAN